MNGAIKVDYEIETDNKIVEKGNVLPPWAFNYDLHQSYSDSNGTYFFVNNTHSKDYRQNKIWIQFGQNKSGWANIAYYAFTLDVTELTEDHAIIKFFPEIYHTRTTDYSHGGMPVHSSMTIETNNRTPSQKKTIFEEDTMTGKTGNHYFGENYGYSDKLLLVPGKTKAFNSYVIDKISHYSNTGETAEMKFKFIPVFDISIKTLYTPMGLRINNKYEAIDSFDKGAIHVRTSLIEDNSEKEDYSTENVQDKGHNRYRKGTGWFQIPVFKA